MAIGFVNRQLLKTRLRQHVSLVAVTGEVLEPHAAAVLIGYGTIAIYPWLLYASVLELGEKRQQPHASCANHCRMSTRP
jgi:glutamate synthase (NADPH) large chain